VKKVSVPELRQVAVDIIADYAGVSPESISMGTKLVDLGMDDLAMVEMIMALEEELEMGIPDGDVPAMETHESEVGEYLQALENFYLKQWPLRPFRVYFAHPVSHYSTLYEERCLAGIRQYFEGAGFLGGRTLEVVNPNEEEHVRAYKEQGFRYFRDLVKSCDAVAGSPFVSGVFGMGVYQEMLTAMEAGKPVFGITDGYLMEMFRNNIEEIQPLSIAETRARVKEGLR
jgi:acyl carrier protein